MRNIILNQRAERDKLMARPYQQLQTKHDVDELLANLNGQLIIISYVITFLNENSPLSDESLNRHKPKGKDGERYIP